MPMFTATTAVESLAKNADIVIKNQRRRKVQ